MNGYDLSKRWFDYCFQNPELIKPIHTAIYMFAIERCNRLGWKDKFGFPSALAMEVLGIHSYTTYIKALNDIVEWGFITMIERSKNQYSSNIIALLKNDEALVEAHDKASVKQLQSTSQSTVSINKLYKTNKHTKELNSTKGEKHLVEDVNLNLPTSETDPLMLMFFEQYGSDSKQASLFYNHYKSQGWLKNNNMPITDWQPVARIWIDRGRFGTQTNKVAQTTATDEQLRAYYEGLNAGH